MVTGDVCFDILFDIQPSVIERLHMSIKNKIRKKKNSGNEKSTK